MTLKEMDFQSLADCRQRLSRHHTGP